MNERAVSNRALAERTKQLDPDGNGITHGHIANIASGGDRPSPAALRLLARALGVEPSYFAEYRLAVARDRLNEDAVGIEAALRALDRVRALLDLDEAVEEAERRFE